MEAAMQNMAMQAAANAAASSASGVAAGAAAGTWLSIATVTIPSNAQSWENGLTTNVCLFLLLVDCVQVRQQVSNCSL